MSLILAQTSGSSVASVIGWSMALVGIIIVAFLAYTRFKRWMSDTGVSNAAGFTFSDLRDLHKQGKISDQEFETARVRMVASAKKLTADLPNPLRASSKPPPPPAAQPGSDRRP